jgi:D-3-phosphoglycerate dehydrogenase
MKILIASSIDPEAIEKLKEQHDVVCAFNAATDTLKSVIKDREVLVFRSGVDISAEVMACAPDLKLLIRAGSGIDNLDLEYVNKYNLKLVRIPEPGAKAVAELSFALMLALARNILTADRLLRQGRWAKHQLTGQLLTGKVLGLVGVGNLGERMGQLGVAWDMQVIGCVGHPTPAKAARLRAKGINLTDFDQVLAEADFISVQTPLQESTRHLISTAALARMKPGAFLVNVARGGVVDETALYQALTEGRLGGAALDVHEAEGEGKISPLANLENVILTPHIGASAIDSQREIGTIVLETVNTFITLETVTEAIN